MSQCGWCHEDFDMDDKVVIVDRTFGEVPVHSYCEEMYRASANGESF